MTKEKEIKNLIKKYPVALPGFTVKQVEELLEFTKGTVAELEEIIASNPTASIVPRPKLSDIFCL